MQTDRVMSPPPAQAAHLAVMSPALRVLDEAIFEQLMFVLGSDAIAAFLVSLRRQVLQSGLEIAEFGAHEQPRSLERVADEAHGLKALAGSAGLIELAHVCAVIQEAAEAGESRRVREYGLALPLIVLRALHCVEAQQAKGR